MLSLDLPKEIYKGFLNSILTLKLSSVHSLISREYPIFCFESDAFYPNSKAITSLVTSISERLNPSSNYLFADLKFGTFIGSLNFISTYPSRDIPLILG